MTDEPKFQHDGRTKAGKAERAAWRMQQAVSAGTMENETMSEDQEAPAQAEAPYRPDPLDRGPHDPVPKEHYPTIRVQAKQPVPFLWDGKWRRRGSVFDAKRGEILVLRGQATEVDPDTPLAEAPTQMESLEGQGVL